MRHLVLSILLLACACLNLQPAIGATTKGVPRVVIEKRKVVIVRTGRLAREFPERKRAVVNYPIVRGPKNSEVLRKVRVLLNLKNVFDTSLEEYREDAWLTDFDYQVNYNQNYILDITFTQNGVGAYPDTHTKHFAINLKNGELIKASDAFKKESLDVLGAMVDKKLQAEVLEIIKQNSEHREAAQEMLTGQKIDADDLDDFSVSARGITFLYDAGFPHATQAFQPEGRYFFSYAELKPFIAPDGPLGIFIR
jgi:hypothetical protein